MDKRTLIWGLQRIGGMAVTGPVSIILYGDPTSSNGKELKSEMFVQILLEVELKPDDPCDLNTLRYRYPYPPKDTKNT
jgi:hypothetical protein